MPCTTDTSFVLHRNVFSDDSSDLPGRSAIVYDSKLFRKVAPHAILGVVIENIAFQIARELSREYRDAIIAELDSYRDLGFNWDGYGAKQVQPAAIERAKYLVQRLPVLPEVSPTTYGAVQLEYENESGDYLEFEVFGDASTRFYASADRSELKERVIHTDEQILAEVTAFQRRDIERGYRSL